MLWFFCAVWGVCLWGNVKHVIDMYTFLWLEFAHNLITTISDSCLRTNDNEFFVSAFSSHHIFEANFITKSSSWRQQLVWQSYFPSPRSISAMIFWQSNFLSRFYWRQILNYRKYICRRREKMMKKVCSITYERLKRKVYGCFKQ